MRDLDVVQGAPCGCKPFDPPVPLWGTSGMYEDYGMSPGYFGGVSQLDSINGASMGPFSGSTAPANPVNVASAQQAGALNPLSAVPVVGNANAVLVWWFILVGLLVASHVLTLKLQH